MLTTNETPVLTGWQDVCGEEFAENPRALETRARAALEAHPHFHGRARFVRCIAAGDVLRLEGCVPCFYLKQLAQEAVMAIPGMLRIENAIVVASPEGEVVDCDAMAAAYRYDQATRGTNRKRPHATTRPR